MPLHNKTQWITTLAMLAAVALVLSWVDSMIPVSGALPGAKLGLANLSVLMGLYLLGTGAGMVLCLLKVLLSTLLFGNAFSFFYALAGSVLSFAVMLLLTVPALIKGRLSRPQGIALLCIYAAFCVVQFTI